MSASTFTPPSIGSAGLSIPSYQTILNYLVAQFQQIYGVTIALDNSSSDYQFLSIVALLISDMCQALQLEYNNRAPNFAIGAALDSLVSINGLARKAPTYSTVSLTITGTAGAVITDGQVTDTVFGYTWILPTPFTIGGGGTITVTATCQTAGAVEIPASSGPTQYFNIATPQAGWTGVTNASASSPGEPVEADSQLRTRQSISVELPSETLLAGTYAGLLAVPGVTRVNIDENTGSTTNSNGTPGHSIQAVVEGGVALDIATAIYNNRGIGPGTYGTTTVAVTDLNTGVVMNISFDYAVEVPIYVIVNAHPTSGSLTSQQTSAIQAAIVAYLNSLEIGETVSFGAIVAAASNAVNPNPAPRKERVVLTPCLGSNR